MAEEIQPIQPSHSPLLICVSLFFLGLGLVYGVRILQMKLKPTTTFSPSLSTLILSPPTQSLQGKIIASSGIVEKRGREDTEFQPLKGTTVVQGDSIATKQGTIEIEFGPITSLKLFPNSEIGFVNLLPNSNLFRQSSGTIMYELDSPFAGPPHLSLRVLYALIDLESSGTITVSITLPLITIASKIEKVKIALVDLENNTHVYTINLGQTAVINDETRSVEIQ